MKSPAAEKRQSLRRVIGNNLFLVKFALRQTPLYFFMSCFYPVVQRVEVFVEHTLGIKYLTDLIQYGEPFTKALTYLIWVTIFIAATFVLEGLYYQSIQLKGREKLHKNLRMLLYEKARQLDLACYDEPDYYNEFVFSLNEAANRMDKTTDFAGQFCAAVTVLLTTGAFILVFDPVGLLFVLGGRFDPGRLPDEQDQVYPGPGIECPDQGTGLHSPGFLFTGLCQGNPVKSHCPQVKKGLCQNQPGD